MLEFRILGPLEVLDDDQTIELGGARQRAVLTILLLHRGEAVPTERIVDLLWGEPSPPTAIKTVQVYVSHLRRALVEDVIVSSRGAYTFTADPERIDALRFERLVQQGQAALVEDDAAGAVERFRAALALWRGPALADFVYERFAQDDAAHLEELRLVAIEERVEAELRLGRHLALVPELERLVREHPVRERLRAQHMLALYRSGRQTDALESFRDVRRALDEELGLEPGPELRRLEQAILAHDPVLAPPSPRARSEPRAGPRRRRFALIAVGAALAGTAGVVALNTSRANEPVAVSPNSVAVIDPELDRVVADVPVGARPEMVVADARGVWVANVADGSISQIDAIKRRVVATIAPDAGTDGLAIGGGSAWISDSGRGRVLRVDLDFATTAESISFPTENSAIRAGTANAAAFGGDALWVTSPRLARVFRIDVAERRADARVDVGNNPAAIAYGAGAVWVADSLDNTLTRIVPTGGGAVTDTIAVGDGPEAVAATPDAIWVASAGDGKVYRVNPARRAVEAVIRVGEMPSGIAVGAGAVWVANSLSGTVTRIDPRTNTVTRTIEVGGAPRSLAVGGGHVWVSVQEAPSRPAPTGRPGVARMVMEQDPATPIGLAEEHLMQATCARLMTYESRSDDELRLVPEVAAAAPTVADGGRRYTFRIRPGYRFSPPNSEPVSADAFVRAIERTLHPRASSWGGDTLDDVVGATAYRAGRADRVAGVSAQGDELTIRLRRPSPTFVARVSTLDFCAVPPNTPVRPRGLEQIASAGPYYVAASEPHRRLTLRRNPNYSGPRTRRLEAIEVVVGVDPQRAVADVEAGRADYLAQVPANVQARLFARYGPAGPAAAAGQQRYFADPNGGMQGLVFNPERPLFARAAVRRAVNYALDRQALARIAIPEMLAARPTDQHIPPGWPGFRDAQIYPLGGPDLDTARRLIGPQRRHGVYYTCNFPECVESAEIVRANLAAIGITLEIRRFTFTDLFKRLATPDEPYDLAEWGWGGAVGDPADFLNEMFDWVASTRAYHGTRLERRMRAATALDGAARIEAYGALDRDFAVRTAPFAPVRSSVRTDFFSARIGCQRVHPLYGIDLAGLCTRG